MKQINVYCQKTSDDSKRINDLVYELDVKNRNLNVLEHKFNIQMQNTEKLQLEYDRLLESSGKSNQDKSSLNMELEK